MTIKEAFNEIRNNLMNIETKGESAIHLVNALQLVAQLESAIIVSDNAEPVGGIDENTNDDEAE